MVALLSGCASLSTGGVSAPTPTLAQQVQKACGILPTEQGIVQIVLQNEPVSVKTTGIVLSVEAALSLVCAYYGAPMTGPVATPTAQVQITPSGGSTAIIMPAPAG
jgi:hypothetical protein